MNRLQLAEHNIAAENRSGLVTYLSAAVPDLQTSLSALRVLADAGADMIELGLPFSDPMADGPSIQAANLRALENGFRLPQALQLVRELRQTHQRIPVILMGYANPIFQYGVDAFCQEAAAAGADALLVVDLPLEESDEWERCCERHGLLWPRMLASATTAERMQQIQQRASGFLYYVSQNGITGQTNNQLDPVIERIAHLQHCSRLPLAIGFGLRNAQQLRQLNGRAPWLVVGSALVETLLQDLPAAQLLEQLQRQVSELGQSLR